MPPILHCVRHAQGWHNLPGYDMSRRDPGLTPKGEQQSDSLASTFPFHPQISQVFASPLQRTIATAYLAFQPSLQNSHCLPEILALPDAQETSEYPCDIGSDVADLRRICDEAGWKVNLSLVPTGWNDKSWDGRWAPTAKAIRARARDARRTIRERVAEMQNQGQDSPQVVLVSHGGFLHYFTEDWEDSGLFSVYNSGRISDIVWGVPGTGWANTEYRSYNFEADDDVDAGVRETAESRKRRGKTGRQPSRAEQTRLFEMAMQQWEDQGMQDGSKVGWRDEMQNGNEGRGTGEEPAAGVVSAESTRTNEVRL